MTMPVHHQIVTVRPIYQLPTSSSNRGMGRLVGIELQVQLASFQAHPFGLALPYTVERDAKDGIHYSMGRSRHYGIMDRPGTGGMFVRRRPPGKKVWHVDGAVIARHRPDNPAGLRGLGGDQGGIIGQLRLR